jgi:flagellar hook-associated protein 2
MIYDDQIGLGFTDTDLQTALDAEFLVNDLSFSRSCNTGISDVVIGLTLNFAPDAEGKVATLTVEKDTESLRGTIDTFLESFNSLQTYIQDKTSVEQTGDGIYTRGSLSNDFIFSDLRSNLFSSFISDYTTTGSFASLRELGITIDDNLNATITDSAALEDALENNLDDVAALLDQVMGDVDSTLDRFTGADGYLDGAVDTFDDQLSDISTDITEMDLRLESREESLIFQYGQLQAQLINLNYMQQQWAGIYNRTNTNTFI